MRNDEEGKTITRQITVKIERSSRAQDERDGEEEEAPKRTNQQPATTHHQS